MIQFDPFAIATEGAGPQHDALQWAMWGWASVDSAVYGRGDVSATIGGDNVFATVEVGIPVCLPVHVGDLCLMQFADM